MAECLFTAQTVAEIPPELCPADVVVLTYTFDHLPEPLPFLEAVRTILEPRRGVLVIEVHDLERIMERRETCLFEHEHSIYLTSDSFRRLLYRCRLRARHHRAAAGPGAPHARCSSSPPRRAPSTWWSRLVPLGRDFDCWETYADFGEDVEHSHAALRDWVRERRAAGERGRLGCRRARRDDACLHRPDAGRGRLPRRQQSACPRPPGPGSHVPVVAPEHLAAAPVDHLIVISYGYMDEIREDVHELGAEPRIVSLLDLLRTSAA